MRMRDVFGMPYEALRERYARSQLTAAWGPDIDAWLEGQGKISKFSDDQKSVQRWLQIISKEEIAAGIRGRETDILSIWATPASRQSDRIPERIRANYPEWLHPFILMMGMAEGIKLFYGMREVVIAGESNGHKYGYLLEGGDSRVVMVNAEAVTSIVLAEWRYGRSEAERARTFLIGACMDAVEKLRHEYETAFDKAVAVSADDTVLVNADEVLVFSGKSPPVSVTREDFRKGKILLAGSSKPVRIQCESRAKAIQSFLAALPEGHAQEMFLIGDAGPEQKTLLLTVYDYSPFPAGSKRGFGLFGR